MIGTSSPNASGGAPARILALCTGNVARSVMVTHMVEHWATVVGVAVETQSAGTLVTEDQPVGMRTRNALASIPALGEVPVWLHRSRQLTADQLAWADLVVAMEAYHVRFVRRHHPDAADRVGGLRHLSQYLMPGSDPLAQRVAELDLSHVALDASEDIADPAGGELEDYRACAVELWGLTEELAKRL
jgi:protein arginine phosphatase